MNVTFIFNEFSLHNHIITDYIRSRPGDRISIVKVPLVLKGKNRLETAGTILPRLPGSFIRGKAVEFLTLLAITMMPKLLARGAVFRRLRRIARAHRAPFHKTEDLSSPATLDYIRTQQPDVIVTLVHQIIRRPLIDIPRLGIINIHPGLLPSFRGIQPYFWELSENWGQAGPTLHFIEDEKIDTGRVLAQAAYRTWKGMSVQLNYFLTCCSASLLLPACLELLEKDELNGQLQALHEGNYYKWPDEAAFRRLQANGFSLISARDLFAVITGRYDDFRPENISLSKRE